jgi:hypothetical protein
VGHLVDHAVDHHIETLSQNLRQDPASKGLNRSYELSDLMSGDVTGMAEHMSALSRADTADSKH